MTLVHGARWPAEGFTLQDDTGAPITGFHSSLIVYDKWGGTILKTLTDGAGGDNLLITGSTCVINSDVTMPPCPDPKVPYVMEWIVVLANGHKYPQYSGPVLVNPSIIVP